MSMEIKTGYTAYTSNQQSIKDKAEKVTEKEPEIPGGQEVNRDTLIFGSSPYAKDNFSDYFMSRVKSLAEKLPELALNAEPREQITFSEWYGKEVTVSEQSQKILDGVAARKEAQRAATEAMKTLEPENPFIMTGDLRKQYMVFTEALYKNDFYKDMSVDDILKVQGILQDITSGMDSINGAVRKDLKSEISHEAARLELVSSVNALKTFSEKFVPEEMRGSFNALIEQYESYNGAKVAAHRNIYDMRDESMKNFPAPDDEAKASAALGKVTHSAEQAKANSDDYRKLFDSLRENPDDKDVIFDSVRKAFMGYASGGSNNSAVLQLLETRNNTAIRNMYDYWGKLLGFSFAPQEEE